MLYISFRGLTNGQDQQTENTPNQISKAFGQGLSVMVDAWRVDGTIYLGASVPTTEVSANYLKGKRFYIYCHNNDMYTWLQSQNQADYPNYFFVQLPLQPYYTVSNGKLWTFAEKPINTNSIMAIPESYDSGLFSTVNLRAFGVCSSLCNYIKRIRNEGRSIYGSYY